MSKNEWPKEDAPKEDAWGVIDSPAQNATGDWGQSHNQGESVNTEDWGTQSAGVTVGDWGVNDQGGNAVKDDWDNAPHTRTEPLQGQGAKKRRPNHQGKGNAPTRPKDKDEPRDKPAKNKSKPKKNAKDAKDVKDTKEPKNSNPTNDVEGANAQDNTPTADTVTEEKAEKEDTSEQKDEGADNKGNVEEKKDTKEREKKKPYVNPERFRTGGSQVEKLTPEELTQRMEAIRLKNEQIKQRRAAVEADEKAFIAIQQAEEKKRQANRKVQEQINHTRDEIARRKMEKMKDREWDNQKKGGPRGGQDGAKSTNTGGPSNIQQVSTENTTEVDPRT